MLELRQQVNRYSVDVLVCIVLVWLLIQLLVIECLLKKLKVISVMLVVMQFSYGSVSSVMFSVIRLQQMFRMWLCLQWLVCCFIYVELKVFIRQMLKIRLIMVWLRLYGGVIRWQLRQLQRVMNIFISMKVVVNSNGRLGLVNRLCQCVGSLCRLLWWFWKWCDGGSWIYSSSVFVIVINEIMLMFQCQFQWLVMMLVMRCLFMLLMVLLLMYRFIVRLSVWLFIFLVRQVMFIVGMLFSVMLSSVCSIRRVDQLFIIVVVMDNMLDVSSVVIIILCWLMWLEINLVISIDIVSRLVLSDSVSVLLVVDMLKWWLNLGSSGCMVQSRLKVEKFVRNRVVVVCWNVGVFCMMWEVGVRVVVLLFIVLGFRGWVGV